MNYFNRNGYSLVKLKYIQKEMFKYTYLKKKYSISILMALHGETLKIFDVNLIASY